MLNRKDILRLLEMIDPPLGGPDFPYSCIIGGAAMVLQGIKEETKDIDILVRVRPTTLGTLTTLPVDIILEEEWMKSIPTLEVEDGWRVASPEGILRMKKTRMESTDPKDILCREKDSIDIRRFPLTLHTGGARGSDTLWAQEE